MWSHWGLETSDWNDGKRLEVVGFCCFLWRLSALTSGSVTFVWKWLQEPSHNVNKCISKITVVFIVGIVLTHSWTLQTTKLPEHLLRYRWTRIRQCGSAWVSMFEALCRLQPITDLKHHLFVFPLLVVVTWPECVCLYFPDTHQADTHVVYSDVRILTAGTNESNEFC